MTDRVDAIVVGAGAIGLGVARALAQAGHEVIVLESEAAIGTGITARSSEVIHAGLYYPAGSTKAEMCVAGRIALYEYAARHGIPHRRTGKLIVAANDTEANRLAELEQQGRISGVGDLELVDNKGAAALESELHAVAALSSPSTGIVDSHALMLAFRGEIEDHGGRIALRARFLHAEPTDAGYRVHIGLPGNADMALDCRMLVNAGGLGAQAIARAIAGLDHAYVPAQFLAKGSYFTCAASAPFRHLIYPLPDSGGLGIHLTFDLGGQARFGPDVEWVEHEDYAVDAARADDFAADVRRYFPALDPGSLQPGYSGIRPKIVAEGDPPGDFVIQGPAYHGLPGLVNLFGIESPGLTAALAIADRVLTLLVKGI